MRKVFYVLIGSLGLLFTSCIPNKDLVYFQGDPKINKNIEAQMQAPYKLQVNDILDIRIKADDDELVNYLIDRLKPDLFKVINLAKRIYILIHIQLIHKAILGFLMWVI